MNSLGWRSSHTVQGQAEVGGQERGSTKPTAERRPPPCAHLHRKYICRKLTLFSVDTLTYFKECLATCICFKLFKNPHAFLTYETIKMPICNKFPKLFRKEEKDSETLVLGKWLVLSINVPGEKECVQSAGLLRGCIFFALWWIKCIEGFGCFLSLISNTIPLSSPYNMVYVDT